MSTSRTRRTWILAAVVAVAVAVVVVLGNPDSVGLGRERLHALFEGEEEFAPTREARYAPLIAYRTERWLSEDNASWEREALQPTLPDDPYKYVDGAERERFEAMLLKARKLDGTTRASRTARLQSPTVYQERRLPRFLTIVYPTDNALFPPNLCPPIIEWSDAHNDFWQVTVTLDEEHTWRFLSEDTRCRVPDDAWETLTTQAVGRDASVQVRGVKRSGLWGKARESVHVSAPVVFSVSRDPADVAVVYRLIDPPFASYKTPDVFVRDIREKESTRFLRSRRKYCFNCHVFSRKSGRGGKLCLQVRYMGQKKTEVPVYFALHDLDSGETMRTSLPWKVQMTTFSAWSPDETKLAFSANQAIATLPPVVYETQQAGMPSSDLAVYDTTTQTASLLPGAADDNLIQIYPRWTPDGEEIVYCRSRAGVHPAMMHLQLYKLPYNGGQGGRTEPIVAAAKEDKSNYYPRFSPDGTWFSFVRSDGGSMIKSSSDIYLLRWSDRDKPGVTAHALASNAPFAADSWHSWSSDGKWIVFASKRDDGVFARLYFTHIDAAGRASVPVRLPLTEVPMMSYNVPEFLASVPSIPEKGLYDGVRIEREPVAVGRGDGN